MIDNKKEQERAELHRTIWNIANDLRGSVDGWDFKQYVLGMLFYRYISKNLAAYINDGEHAAGDTDFSYAALADSDAEQKIRKYLIDNNFIDCVFQLPDNLFFGTSIATCIMVMRRSKNDNSTLFIDASREFVKVTNNNKLTQANIEKIVAAYTSRKTVEHFTKLVPNKDIAEQGYNLSVSTYIEQEDTREVIDITALNTEIERIVTREDVLRREINAIITEIEGAAK